MIVLYIALGLALLWLWPVRPWLRSRPQCATTWARIDAWEAMLWSRSRTLFAARWVQIAGYVTMVDGIVRPVLVEAMPLLQAAGIDPVSALPDRLKWIGPGLVVLGLVFSKLRKETTEALDDKEPA